MKKYITDRWDSYLNRFDAAAVDIYYEEGYVKLYESKEGKALCAICEEDDRILLMPFIRKEIDGCYDFETAYGYGGPIANTGEQSWIDGALSAMADLFAEEGYVCGFVRFHPLLANSQMCRNHMQVLFDRNTVVIDTAQPEEQIWADQITSKNRNMIRKAEKNGLVYQAEYDFASLRDFVELYHSTMKRLEAEDFYFFDQTYYDAFAEHFENKAFLGTVRKDNKLICGALFMYSKEYGHYHLEGSDHAFSNLGANNLLLWKTALEFHQLGVKEFHLGGGYDASPDNSLLKFKKSFSGNRGDFFIGKWIFQEDKYAKLKEKWAGNHPDKVEKYGKLLLCYRY